MPSRGDFVRVGLPRGFTDPWDSWLSTSLNEGRARLGESFAPCWMEAPVWRFALAPGVCGPDAALGLWVPSVDWVGRLFPLTVAAVTGDLSRLLRSGAAWLDAAEAAACAAVVEAGEPDWLAHALPPFPQDADPSPLPDPGRGAAWWTDGAPRVPAVRLTTCALPGPATFAAMLESTGAE